VPKVNSLPLLNVAFAVYSRVHVAGLFLGSRRPPAHIGERQLPLTLVVAEGQLTRLRVVNVDHARLGRLINSPNLPPRMCRRG